MSPILVEGRCVGRGLVTEAYVVCIFVSGRRIVLAGILLVLSLPLPAGQPVTGVPEITVCYNYGCKHMVRVALTPAEWNEVLAVFATAAGSASLERQQIRQAVALMEQFVGRQTPTWRDRGKNPPTDAWPGQLDCIDESINTTRYLQLFATYGGLRWHRVSERVVRAPLLFDLHWAGQLVERATQRHYAVDSWYLDNGELPYIQPLDEWRGKQPFRQTAAVVLNDG